MPDGTWGTDPVFAVENGDVYYYHNDHLGTPWKMTDGAGAVVWSAQYSVFGEAHVDSASSVENNLRFPGQYFDVETGLHYNFHRYYDPSTGRYISSDPIGFEGGFNFYGYANGNTLIFTDPLGYSPTDDPTSSCYLPNVPPKFPGCTQITTWVPATVVSGPGNKGTLIRQRQKKIWEKTGEANAFPIVINPAAIYLDYAA